MSEALPALVELIERHLAAEARQAVRPPADPSTLRAELDLALGERPSPFGDVVQALDGILAATPSTATPRFFNQLYGGRDGAAFVGETLAALLNNSMYTYKVAGVHTLIELELVQRMGAMVGFEDPEGSFMPGGSLSNLVAMLVARNETLPDTKDHGLSGTRLRVYTSIDSHYSVPKAAGILGIGRANVVRIPVDAQGRMEPAALDVAIRQDIAAGHTPMMVNATAGTTVLGAFDPLPSIAEICAEHGVWLHVDAAYGGSMLFHEDFAEHFEGLHRADSVTWDAHKMMGVPLTCSVVLVKHKGLLTKHLNETATYLFQDDSDDLNPGTRSLQCGRRNSALKLWTAWKTHGDAGFRKRMHALRDLAIYARDQVVSRDDMHLVREPASLNVCFTVDGMPADRLCRALNVQGLAMVGHAHVDSSTVVRAVFLDPGQSPADVDALLDALSEVAQAGRRRAS